MKYKLIACNVFSRELEHLLPAAPHVCDVEYLELGEHARPAILRRKLQAAVDAADPQGYDAILLAYGLCGRATEGVAARTTPLVLIRSHDCGGILLGSRKRFEEIFSPMPSTPYSSVGFIEHGEYFYEGGELQHGDSYAQLVEQYGEEDAKYIYDAMHPKLNGEAQPVYFIISPEIPSDDARAYCKERAAADEREYRELAGSLHLLAALLAGDWDRSEFLVVPPGSTLRQVGDWDEIIRVADAAPDTPKATGPQSGENAC